MNKEKTNNQDYIEDLAEWQENQYNPGHYMGGKIPGYLLYGGRQRQKYIGILLTIISIMTITPLCLATLDFFRKDTPRTFLNYVEQLLPILLYGSFSAVLLVGGIKKIVISCRKDPEDKANF